MLTIISGTNRSNSMTSKVANTAMQIAKDADIPCTLIDLSEIPTDYIHSDQYAADSLPAWLITLQENALIKANHFLIISPEYNGSIPGYLKLFIDAISVHRLKESFSGKQAALIGVASGRAGNLRGMDHLSSIMNHIGCNVVPGSLPISNMGSVIDENGKMKEDTKDAVQALIKKLVAV